MDFLEDLLDFGHRKNRRGHGYDDHDRDHHGHDDHFSRDDHHDDRKTKYRESSGREQSSETIKCGQCGEPIERQFNFCPYCGTRIPRARKCASCGGEVAAQAKFCPSCGVKAD